MAPKHLVIGIDWFGPYALTEARAAASKDYLGGLYFCIGKRKGEHHSRMQYIGKSSKNLYSRMWEDHHKLEQVSRERKIWLGEIVTGNVPGRKKISTPETIHLGEWAIAYFLKLPLNDKLTKTAPKRPVTILNRWWQIDYETPRKKRPHPKWPDVIDYRGPIATRIAWFRAPGLRLIPSDG